MKIYSLLIKCGFWLTVLSCFCVGQSKSAGANPELFSPEEIRSDLKFLYATLEPSHYDLYAHTPKKIFEARFKQIDRTLTRPMTLLEVNRLFQPFAALSGLAHCSIEYPFAASYRPYAKSGGTMFPLDVAIKEGKVVITDNFSTNSAIAKGDELVGINGTPARDKLQAIYRYLSGENENFKNTLIDLLSFSRLYWLVNGQSDSYRLKLKKSNGKTQVITVNAIPAMALEEKLESKPSIFEPGRKFEFIGSTAYLRPGQFSNSKGGGDTSDHRTFEKGEFVDFIDNAFARIKERKANNLIIDLRGNPGGDNSFSDAMVAYFADKPFWFCSRFSLKTSAVTKSFWKDVDEPSLAVLKAQILTKPDGAVFDAAIEKYSPRSIEDRFTGKVYVLINRFTYSNAVTTAAMIQDYKFGTLIGETTADVPTTYGAVHEFRLPNTQMAVTYPKALMVRPNGDMSSKGLTPDLKVQAEEATSKDEVLDFALALTARQ
jgi:hypothetical protein